MENIKLQQLVTQLKLHLADKVLAEPMQAP